MNSWIVRKARAAWLFGFVVVLAGFVPVTAFVVQAVLVQFHGWPTLGEPTGIPTPPHAALVIAVAGFVVMMLGARIARRQTAVLKSAARHREDSLRRARHYQDGDRIEPFIGPGLPG